MGPAPLSRTEKAELRTQALARRGAIAPEARGAAAEAVARAVADLAIPAGPVAAYWPILSELDPLPAAAALRGRGHEIVLPCVTEAGLVFRRWRDGDPLVRAGLGLMEPDPEAEALVPRTLLVPLAAFDRRGHRIGYGKGFYDRALAALPAPVLTIGLAFATQEIPLIPDEPHDHPLDFVVTEREIIDARATRGF